jgi:uncharacterized protein
MLWERVSEEQARTSLRQVVRELVQALGPSANDLIATDRESIGLNVSKCWIDTAAVLSRSNSTVPGEVEIVDPEGISSAQLLEDLYGASAAFDQWLLGERTRFDDKLRGLYEANLREAIATGAPDQCAAIARRLIQFDPTNGPAPAVGIGYRWPIGDWILDHLARFDLLEVTVDHCLWGGKGARSAIFDLIGRVPLTAHGIGLSIGTDEPLDFNYLDRVGTVIERLNAPAYSEHLAFTRARGRELANLLPLPTAETIIGKIREIQSKIPVPFLLENIAYIFEWPESVLSDAEFFNLICRETGAGMLLDVENLHLNARNHGFDACDFLESLPAGVIKEVHIAGGATVDHGFLERPFFADSHSHPVPPGALDLLDRALLRHTPSVIVLERDERLDAVEEILDDIALIRARLCGPVLEKSHAESTAGSAG